MTTTLPRVNSIIVEALEWFDKVNGESYFSARIYTARMCNTAQGEYERFQGEYERLVTSSLVMVLPYENGYGEYYLQRAREELVKQGYIPSNSSSSLARYCRENGILFHSTISPALKREVVKFGKAQL